MMLRFLTVLCISALSVASPASAEDGPAKSLLFSPAEVGAVTRAIADFERMKLTGSAAVVDQKPDEPVIPNVFVSGLAYYGEGQWTVWVNGYKVSPGHQASEFKVISATEEKAEITVASKPAHFVLRPYQTWRSRSNDIVEGIVP